jgi:hypothetical protein
LATTPVDLAIIPLIFLGTVAVIVAVSVISSSRKPKTKSTTATKSERRYTFAPLYQGYAPSQFNQVSRQMELDIRLPYRRFKQIYPHSNYTYEEYKQMQKQKAFKRSMSSQENKRMVR